MKLGPKEIKVVNEYFVRPVKNRLKEIFMKKGLPQLKTPDEIQRPQRALDKEAIDAFMKRNPRADGGRIGFSKAGVVREGRVGGEYEGLFGVRAKNRSAADNIPGATKFGQETVYFKTEKDAKNFLKNFDKYKKAPVKANTTLSDDPTRLKKIDDYVKKFETKYGKKPTAKNIRTALKEQRRVIPIYEKTYDVTLPTGSGAKLTNVEKDIVKILNNKKIIEKLDAGKFPTITDISRITKLDPTLSETRLVDLAEKLKENPKYKKLADDYLAQPGTPGDFGGRKTKRSRIILENRFQKLMQLDQKLPSLRTNILKKIQKLIPELKGVLAVDEIAGITTSMRRGSGPYAIFGQVLGGDFNTQVKGSGVDKIKGQIEKQLIKLPKGSPERIELQKKYNAAVTEFENKANIDNPAKKVKGLKVSFKPPSETIKNKKIYNQYKDLFDTHYKTYGYSFEVPADRDSLVDISKKLDNKSFQGIIKNRFKNLINKGGKIGAGVGLATLAGTGFALADVDGTEAKSILPTAAAGTVAAGTLGTKPGRQLLGKAFRTLGTPLSGSLLAANQIRSNIQSGENVVDAVVDPLVGLELSFPGLFKENLAKITSNPTAQKILRLGKFGRALTPIGAGITAAGLGIDAAKFTKKRIDELRSMTPEQREELRRQGEAQAFDPFQAAGGGLAKLAGDRSGAMLTSMNPDKDGLPGLLKRVKKQ